jgi:hypothetical protein
MVDQKTGQWLVEAPAPFELEEMHQASEPIVENTKGYVTIEPEFEIGALHAPEHRSIGRCPAAAAGAVAYDSERIQTPLADAHATAQELSAKNTSVRKQQVEHWYQCVPVRTHNELFSYSVYTYCIARRRYLRRM